MMKAKTNTRSGLISYLLLLSSFLLFSPSTSAAATNTGSCSDNAECETLIGKGSVCRAADGSCSNPYESGCLYQHPKHTEPKRVCNSLDPPNAVEKGICRESSLGYMEIRVFSQNWESVIFEAWLMQILLSELLDVPATIETGTHEAVADFYDPQNRFQLGTSNDLQALENALQLRDCTNANRGEGLEYQSCAHIVPEVWDTSLPWVVDKVADEKLDPPEDLGVSGNEALFVPKFTGEQHPEFLSYLGLRGKVNRHKLAEAFLRPTKWKAYCEEVSTNNCTIPDKVAQRAPQEQWELDNYFLEGNYTGHFRKTEKNDCQKHPDTCTGHVADYPCGWSSYTEAQMYHLDIGLKGDGDQPHSSSYSYGHLVELWKAANATKSNLMMMWWSPEALYQTFRGTDAEFVPVAFPSPTLECLRNRIKPGARCDANFTVRVGSPLGICAETARPLRKLMVGSLHDDVNDPSIPEASRSPAYEALRRFKVSELDLDEIFAFWKEASSPREALCEWAANNIRTLKEAVPRGYPRLIRDEETHTALVYASTLLAGFVALVVVWATGMVYLQRKSRVMLYSQVEFLFLLLAGSFTISIGAFLMGIPPTDASCVAGIWLINIGYTFELVPLIVKVAALNRLMIASRRFRRVSIERKSLFGAVFVIVVLVVLAMTLWTILDPPLKVAEYELTDGPRLEDRAGEWYDELDPDYTEPLFKRTVSKFYHCQSNSEGWRAASISWHAVLLLVASVLAFQTRNDSSSFSETSLLAMMIYSHFVFVVLRVILNFFLPGVSGSVLARYQSILLSCDTMATILIYFLPKFFGKQDQRGFANSTVLAGSTHGVSSVLFGEPPSIRPIAANPVRRMISNISTISSITATRHRTDSTKAGSSKDEGEGSGHDEVTHEQIYSPDIVEERNEVDESLVPILCTQCGHLIDRMPLEHHPEEEILFVDDMNVEESEKEATKQ